MTDEATKAKEETFTIMGMVELSGRPVWFKGKPMPGRPDRVIDSIHVNGGDVEIFARAPGPPTATRDHVIVHAPNPALIVQFAPLAVWKEDLDAVLEDDESEPCTEIIDVWGTIWKIGETPILKLIPENYDQTKADPREDLPMPGTVERMIRCEDSIEVYIRPPNVGLGVLVTLLPTAVNRTVTYDLPPDAWMERVELLDAPDPGDDPEEPEEPEEPEGDDIEPPAVLPGLTLAPAPPAPAIAAAPAPNGFQPPQAAPEPGGFQPPRAASDPSV